MWQLRHSVFLNLSLYVVTKVFWQSSSILLGCYHVAMWLLMCSESVLRCHYLVSKVLGAL